MNNHSFYLVGRCDDDDSIFITEKVCLNYWVIFGVCCTLLACLRNYTALALIIFIPTSVLLIECRVKLYLEINKYIEKGYSIKVEGNRYSFRSPKNYILFIGKQQHANK